MDYSIILEQIYNFIINNQFIGFAIGAFLVLIILYIASKTFRKSGLFLLTTSFLIDLSIRSLPFDIYNNYPYVFNIVIGLYIAAFIDFLIRVLLILIKLKKKEKREDSSLKNFVKFTGIRPFLLMLIVNLVNFNNVLPKNIINLLTSLSFLYMVFKTLYSTYQYLSQKENIVIDDQMDFSDIDAYLSSDNKNSKKRHRRVLKNKSSIEEAKEKIDSKGPIPMSNFKKKLKADEPIEKIEKDLSNTDIINLMASSNNLVTTMTLTDLNTKKTISYKSEKAKFNLLEDDSYRVDLEFEVINDYDYGRFMDILLAYDEDRERYKFELSIDDNKSRELKMVFFDPSHIDKVNEKDHSLAGKTISLIFPKYKINFIKGNYQ
ncbi:hypothetical protein NH288_09520 [Anaerococcus sp. NML200537]|uniref:CvpA family protein n=1 Tax=Anaerococcus kampingae TaxID=3115614 RepID=A0ABW9MCM4_9FIRM|nr:MULTISPECIES: hypothetical protein [unclassified Anaerococcus]MCW6702318.1 hypothetical protein [Anaerococcus sp. NML200537]